MGLDGAVLFGTQALGLTLLAVLLPLLLAVAVLSSLFSWWIFLLVAVLHGDHKFSDREPTYCIDEMKRLAW